MSGAQEDLDFYRMKYPRTMKLMEADRKFIVVAGDEPYYIRVYTMIRMYEKRKNTWTEEDEEIFKEEYDRVHHDK